MEDAYLTIKELAHYLKVKQSTVYNWVNHNRVPVSRVVGQWRFKRSEIDEWIKRGRSKLIQAEIQRGAPEGDGKFKEIAEKRRFFRLAKRFPVKCSSTENPEKIFQATASNISKGGIFIAMDNSVHNLLSSLKAQNKKLKLTAELPGEGAPKDFFSEIAWLSKESLFKNTIGAGLKFVDLPPETNSRLSSYILNHSIMLDGELEFPMNFPFRLESSIVIKRKQNEIYALLKQMEDFPKFLEDVKSVKIIDDNNDKIVSEWKAEIDGLLVNWRQVSILDKGKTYIRFKMLDGDFENYMGEWSLQQLLTGTELKLTLIVDWGMPKLVRYTENALREKIDNFIQRILIGIKAKLWTEKSSKLTKFSCIIHTTELGLFSKALDEPTLRSGKLLDKTFEWTPPFKCANIIGLQSQTGKKVDGELIMCTLFPKQILDVENRVVLFRVIEAGKLAKERGAKIIGLGAYVAGVGRKGVLVRNALDMPVTTGTNYTIAMAIEGVLEAARSVGIDLSSADVAIVGATGSIGKICSQILCREVSHLSLVGRNEVRLKELASLLRSLGKSQLQISTEVDKIVPRSDIIITATNSPYTLIKVDLVQSGSILCDISIPRNVSEKDALKRKDILVIDGGLVKPPGNVNFNFNYGLAPDLTYACMAETMILALEERFESYSLGGDVSLEKVKEIARLGKIHGFQLAKLRSFGKEVTEGKINEVRKACSKRKGKK